MIKFFKNLFSEKPYCDAESKKIYKQILKRHKKDPKKIERKPLTEREKEVVANAHKECLFNNYANERVMEMAK